MHKEKYIRSLKQNTWNKLAAKKSCWILGLQTVHQSVYSLRFPRRPLPACLLQFCWNFLPEQVAVKEKSHHFPLFGGYRAQLQLRFLFFTLNSWDTKNGARSKTQITALPTRQGGSLSLWNRCQEKQCFLSALPGRRCRVLQRVHASHRCGCAGGGRPGESFGQSEPRTSCFHPPLLCIDAEQLHLQFDLCCR